MLLIPDMSNLYFFLGMCVISVCVGWVERERLPKPWVARKVILSISDQLLLTPKLIWVLNQKLGVVNPPKWMVKIMVPNPIKMDDFGGFHPYFWVNTHMEP